MRGVVILSVSEDDIAELFGYDVLDELEAKGLVEDVLEEAAQSIGTYIDEGGAFAEHLGYAIDEALGNEE